MVINLSETPSLVSQYLAEIRDITVQGHRMRFRRNLERLAEIAAYHISQKLEWEERIIHTPMDSTKVRVLKEQPLIANILRAGLPMHQGLLNYFDKADSAFISAYRKHNEQGEFIIELEYLSSPSIDGRVLIVADPMLATGASMALTLKALKKLGQPKKVHIVCAISSVVGIDKVLSELPEVTIWTGDIDEKLNDKAYIVPGLGDAGDLAFGNKMQS